MTKIKEIVSLKKKALLASADYDLAVHRFARKLNSEKYSHVLNRINTVVESGVRGDIKNARFKQFVRLENTINLWLEEFACSNSDCGLVSRIGDCRQELDDDFNTTGDLHCPSCDAHVLYVDELNSLQMDANSVWGNPYEGLRYEF